MSRKYEGLIVLNPKTTDTGISELASAVAKEMEGSGAKMDEIQQMGRKKFAYNARQIEGGHYVNYVFEAEPEAIEKIQNKLSLNENVYLQHYQRVK